MIRGRVMQGRQQAAPSLPAPRPCGLAPPPAPCWRSVLPSWHSGASCCAIKVNDQDCCGCGLIVRLRTCRSGAQRTMAVHGVPLRDSLLHLLLHSIEACSHLPSGSAYSTCWSAGAPPACGARGAAAGARSGDPPIQRPGALRWLKLPAVATKVACAPLVQEEAEAFA